MQQGMCLMHFMVKQMRLKRPDRSGAFCPSGRLRRPRCPFCSMKGVCLFYPDGHLVGLFDFFWGEAAYFPLDPQNAKLFAEGSTAQNSRQATASSPCRSSKRVAYFRCVEPVRGASLKHPPHGWWLQKSPQQIAVAHVAIWVPRGLDVFFFFLWCFGLAQRDTGRSMAWTFPLRVHTFLSLEAHKCWTPIQNGRIEGGHWAVCHHPTWACY